jgi:hypothetical protein
MRFKLLFAACLATLLAIPVAASAHPFDTTSGAFAPDLPEVFGQGAVAAPSTFGGPPPTAYDKTDNMQFLGYSPRQTTGALNEANSDIAFQRKVAWQGSFKGFRSIDISDPANPRQIFNFEGCASNAGQGDVVIFRNILTRSWDAPAGANATCDGRPVPQGWEGLHVFDVSDPTNPERIADVRTRCGSHTASGVPDLKNRRLLIYNTPSYSATNCLNDPPAAGIEVVEIPLRDPAAARSLRFEEAGNITIRCHDTGVILGKVLKAACAGGDGFAVWSMDPRDGGSLGDPQLLYNRSLRATGHPDVKVGHSAAFSNDGETVIFGHEPDGGVRARCQPTGTVFSDPTANYQVQSDEMKSFIFVDTDTGATKARWVLPRSQTAQENCTLHNYNVVPTRQRDVLVHGSYQSGIGVLDFTDLSNIREVGYADPKPMDPTRLTVGGDWSSHYYNGLIYESDITRGFLSWEFTGTEIRGARKLDRLNPQTQEFTVSDRGGDDDGDSDSD